MDVDSIEAKAESFLEGICRRVKKWEDHPWIEPKRQDIWSDQLRKYPHQICWMWSNPQSPTKREFAIVIEWSKIRYVRRDVALWENYPDGAYDTDDIFFLLWYWLWKE